MDIFPSIVTWLAKCKMTAERSSRSCHSDVKVGLYCRKKYHFHFNYSCAVQKSDSSFPIAISEQFYRAISHKAQLNCTLTCEYTQFSQSGTAWAGLISPWLQNRLQGLHWLVFDCWLPVFKFVNWRKAVQVTESIQMDFKGRKYITVHFITLLVSMRHN